MSSDDAAETIEALAIDINGDEAIIHIARAMRSLGLDLNDPNLIDTPKRIAYAWSNMLDGREDTAERVYDLLTKTSFPSTYDEMIVERGIRVSGICPHHFFPIEYDMAVAYIPHEKCVGISKLARVCKLLAARDVLQETLTIDIAHAIDSCLHPQGVGVLIIGRHGCMTCRGVEQKDSTLKTSKLLGAFEQPETRAEFMMLATTDGGHA